MLLVVLWLISMNDNLNLITSEEKFEQKTSVFFKALNILFILVLLVTIGFSIYSYLEFNKLKNVEDTLSSQKQQLISEVSRFSTEDKLLREIIHRYVIYKKFHLEIEDFSEIVKEVYVRSIGTGVEVMTINFSYDDKEISIRVKSSSEQFTRFVNNLKNTEFKGEGTLYPTLFYPSSKNEEVDQAIKEYIVYVKYKPEVLQK
jgi:hypothetical protein